MDHGDFAILAGCLSGPEVDPAPGCEVADLTTDDDVDMLDVAVFQQLFTGS